MKKTWFFGLCGVLIASLPILAMIFNNRNADAEFARKAFITLARGDAAAEKMIDWNNFKVVDRNIGALYQSQTDETQRSAFRQAFIQNFSKSYHNQGSDPDMLKNWRVQSRDGERVTIEADSPKLPLILVISEVGDERKMTELRLGDDAPQAVQEPPTVGSLVKPNGAK